MWGVAGNLHRWSATAVKNCVLYSGEETLELTTPEKFTDAFFEGRS